MTGSLRLLPLVFLVAVAIAGCGKSRDISGTYIEVEALGNPATILLRPDGTGAFIVNLGSRSIEDPFDWAEEADDDFVLNYFDMSGDQDELVAVERFTFEDDMLVFDSVDGVVRYARFDAEQAVPVEGSDLPFSIF